MTILPVHPHPCYSSQQNATEPALKLYGSDLIVVQKARQQQRLGVPGCKTFFASGGTLHAQFAQPRQELRGIIPAGVAEVNRLVSGEVANPIAVVANFPHKQGLIAWSAVAVRMELDIDAGSRRQGGFLGSD